MLLSPRSSRREEGIRGQGRREKLHTWRHFHGNTYSLHPTNRPKLWRSSCQNLRREIHPSSNRRYEQHPSSWETCVKTIFCMCVLVKRESQRGKAGFLSDLLTFHSGIDKGENRERVFSESSLTLYPSQLFSRHIRIFLSPLANIYYFPKINIFP